MKKKHLEYRTVSQELLEKQVYHAIKMMNEMIEDSIAEVLAWRMFGIDASFYYMFGEFVVEVNLGESKQIIPHHLTLTH